MRRCFVILTLFFINSLAISACPNGQASLTCSCSARYSIGKNEFVNAQGLLELNTTSLRTMFTVASYDDCGTGLTCYDKFDCEENCKRAVLEKLQREDPNVNRYLCQQFSQNQPVRDQYGIRLYASWSYATCRSGNAPIVKDLCCNRRCACDVVLQKAETLVTETFPLAVTLEDQDHYKCSTRDADVCRSKCFESFKNRFSLPSNLDLATLASDGKSLNILDKNQALRDAMCTSFNYVATRLLDPPGGDFFLRIRVDVPEDFLAVQLGRTCCKLDCNCRLKYAKQRYEFEQRGVLLSNSMSQTSYECASQVDICMKFCRNWIMTYNGYKQFCPIESPTPFIDKFSDLDFGVIISDLLVKEPRPEIVVPYDVNLEVQTGSNLARFPYKETLSIGQVCYRLLYPPYLPLNRCVQVTPDKNSCLKY